MVAGHVAPLTAVLVGYARYPETRLNSIIIDCSSWRAGGGDAQTLAQVEGT
jgi:hypothetical protein